MSTKPYVLNYTKRDFKSILEDVKAAIQASVPEWNDFLQSNTGMFMISLFAAIADMENFYIDRSAAECYLNTAVSRASIANILQIINYRLRNATPKYLTLRFSLYNAIANDVIIPIYTEVSTREGSVHFVTTNDAVIPAGQLSVDVPARQGYFEFDTYVSSGSPSQRFTIDREDIGEGFIQVLVDDDQWSEVTDNSFVNHKSTDEVYRLTSSGLDNKVLTTVEFGDGYEGIIPSSGSNIKIKYLVTKGTSAHAPVGTVTNLISTIRDSVNNVVIPRVVNTEKASAGDDSESIESARWNYPRRFKTRGRAVSKPDYRSLSESFPGVLQARVFDLNDSHLIPFFRTQVYVIPADSYSSDALNSTLQSYLQTISSVHMTDVRVNAPDPHLVDFIVGLRVYAAYDQSTVRAAVITAIQEYFTVTRDSEITIGGGLRISRLIDAIQKVPGVGSVVITPDSDIEVNYNEVVAIGTLTVNVIATV